MVFCLLIGRKLGRRKFRQDPEGARAGLGAVEGAIFALLGLLIAFTFSSAVTRFDERRHLVVQEANAIGTAYLRVDLISPALQPELRSLFRAYVEKRIEAYSRQAGPTPVDISEYSALQARIWALSVSACRAEASPAPTTMLLPALNEMFDITTTRSAARLIHPPKIIFFMLCVVSLGAALLAGFAMAASDRPSWLHILAFAAITAGTVYVIFDLEFPRLGAIRIDTIDRLLIDVRANMK